MDRQVSADFSLDVGPDACWYMLVQPRKYGTNQALASDVREVRTTCPMNLCQVTEPLWRVHLLLFGDRLPDPCVKPSDCLLFLIYGIVHDWRCNVRHLDQDTA